jgi:hypothetical protein
MSRLNNDGAAIEFQNENDSSLKNKIESHPLKQNDENGLLGMTEECARTHNPL